MDAFTPQSHPLVRRLESIAEPLSADELQAVIELPMSVRDVKAKQDIVREGDRPSQCCLVLAGLVHRYKQLPDGKRQIMGLYIAGDLPDLMSLHITVMDHDIGTLAPSKLGFIQHEHLRELMRRHPRIGDVFWRDTLIDAAVFREWMVGLGARSAYSRVARFFCEMVVKHRAVGLTTDHSIDLPLTQGELGDAAGISTVHVNRVVQELREHQLISWFGHKMAVLDWEGLKEAAAFDPTYLHLRNSEAA